ncbi:MAG: hypothetical protein J5918_01740 [Prevotella sp.]|nr:hypothetical protein [Prevotella sp.]
MKNNCHNIRKAIIAFLLVFCCQTIIAQDSTVVVKGATDTLKSKKRDWNTWRPSPKKALIMSAILPGSGQIYNQKYWKLPIVYGAFVGCAYAIRWNSMMYDDYSRAYRDITDDDPTTDSYNQFLHLGNEVTEENADRYANMFKRRKDYYRRYRDLSYIVLVGVYALQIVDAYIDASLSEFDISDDLTLNITPTIINNGIDRRPFQSSALGIRCCITF